MHSSGRRGLGASVLTGSITLGKSVTTTASVISSDSRGWVGEEGGQYALPVMTCGNGGTRVAGCRSQLPRDPCSLAGVRPTSEKVPGAGVSVASGNPAPSPPSAGLSFPTRAMGRSVPQASDSIAGSARPCLPRGSSHRGSSGATPRTQSQARAPSAPARGAPPPLQGGAEGSRLSLQGADSPPEATGVRTDGGAHLGPRQGTPLARGPA